MRPAGLPSIDTRQIDAKNRMKDLPAAMAWSLHWAGSMVDTPTPEMQKAAEDGIIRNLAIRRNKAE